MGFISLLKELKRKLSLIEDSSETTSRFDIPERIPYDLIAKKLIEAMYNNSDEIGRKILVPNIYQLFLNKEDRAFRSNVENIFKEELIAELFKCCSKIDKSLKIEDLTLEIFIDESLAKGKFHIHCMRKLIKQVKEEADVPESNEILLLDQLDSDQSEELQSVVQESKEIKDLGGSEANRGMQDQDSKEQEESAELYQSSQEPQVSKKNYRIKIQNDIESKLFLLEKDEIVIGRGKNVDLKLEDNEYKISRRHCFITIESGKLYLIPLGPNGTFLNQKELKLKVRYELKSGDIIGIKNYELLIEEIQ